MGAQRQCPEAAVEASRQCPGAAVDAPGQCPSHDAPFLTVRQIGRPNLPIT